MIVFGRPVTMSRPRISVVDLLGQRRGRADLELDLLGGLLRRSASLCSCLQWLTIASSSSSPPTRIDSRDDDPAERDHRHLAGAAADVEDHAAGRLGDRQARRRSPPPSAPRSGRPGGRPAERQASSTARFSTPVTPEGTQTTTRGWAKRFWWTALDEVPQHLLGDVEVGDHTILQRPDGADRARACGPSIRFASTPTAWTSPVRASTATTEGSESTMPTPAYVDERVRGPEVHRHVAAAEAGQVAKEAHCRVISESLMGSGRVLPSARGAVFASIRRRAPPSQAYRVEQQQRPRRAPSVANTEAVSTPE